MSHNFNDHRQSHINLLNAMAKEIWDVLERYDETVPVASVLGTLEAIKYEIIIGAIERSEGDDFDD